MYNTIINLAIININEIYIITTASKGYCFYKEISTIFVNEEYNDLIR